jgi:hypothetical protein
MRRGKVVRGGNYFIRHKCLRNSFRDLRFNCTRTRMSGLRLIVKEKKGER